MLRVKENPQALGYLPYNLKRCFLPKRSSFNFSPGSLVRKGGVVHHKTSLAIKWVSVETQIPYNMLPGL